MESPRFNFNIYTLTIMRYFYKKLMCFTWVNLKYAFCPLFLFPCVGRLPVALQSQILNN